MFSDPDPGGPAPNTVGVYFALDLVAADAASLLQTSHSQFRPTRSVSAEAPLPRQCPDVDLSDDHVGRVFSDGGDVLARLRGSWMRPPPLPLQSAWTCLTTTNPLPVPAGSRTPSSCTTCRQSFSWAAR